MTTLLIVSTLFVIIYIIDERMIDKLKRENFELKERLECRRGKK